MVKTLSTRIWRGREVPIELTFADYRESGGVPFPRSIETSVPGRPRRLVIVVENVEVNPVLDDARFRTPR